MAILNIRTAYPLEYVPVRARKPRRELVAEIVPVEVAEADDLAVAVECLVDGKPRPETFVHDGALFSTYRDAPTVEEFERHMNGAGHPRTDHWSIRRDLIGQGLGHPCIFSARLRNDDGLKHIEEDGRQSGLMFAQKLADRFLVHKGKVYIRIDAPTVLLAKVDKLDGIEEARFELRFRSGAGASPETVSRAFRPDDENGINDWAERNAPAGWKPYTGKVRETRWTEEGLAAEDMLSWWTIWSARSIYRASSARDWSLLNADGETFRILGDLKDSIDNAGWFLPKAEEAPAIATEIAGHMERLAISLERQGRYAGTVKFLRYMLEERRHTIELRDAPALAALSL